MKRLRIGPVLFLAATLWASTAFGWAFGVCGDSRNDKDGVFRRILAEVAESDMEFLVHTGDLEDRGGTAYWEPFKAKIADFPKPLRLVIGNHEIRGASAEEFERFFGLSDSTYAFTNKDARFVILDNANGTLPDNLLDWLDRELAAHPKGKNGIARIVVAMHIPPQTDNIFPHGTKSSYGSQSVTFLSILLRHKVDLVLSAHEHMHVVDDWSGVTVIVSGGAGARLMPFYDYGYYRIDVKDDGLRETFIPIPKTAPPQTGR